MHRRCQLAVLYLIEYGMLSHMPGRTAVRYPPWKNVICRRLPSVLVTAIARRALFTTALGISRRFRGSTVCQHRSAAPVRSVRYGTIRNCSVVNEACTLAAPSMYGRVAEVRTNRE